MLSEFGPIALQWESGNFSDFLNRGATPFAQEIRALSDSKSVLDYATLLAMCKGSGICGDGGLLYLWICSDTGNCGGSVQNGLRGHITAEESRLAHSIARRILTGIATGEWAAAS